MTGWADLFKSKSPKLKPDPVIRWFGKLPTYADYYSSKAEDAWINEFNDWILKGFEIHHNRGGAARPPGGHAARLPLSGGIVRLPRSQMTVLFSIQDYGGDMRGRPFPLCLYVAVPTPAWPGPGSASVGSAVRVLTTLLKLRREVVRFLNAPGRLESVLGDREVSLDGFDDGDLDDGWIAEARKLSFAEWFAGARDALEVKEEAAWLALAARWGGNITTLDGADFEPTLSLPLARGVPLMLQMAGWLRWLESRMKLTGRSLSLLYVCDERDEEPQRMVVVARELVPEDFLLLSVGFRTLPYVDDLASVKPPDNPPPGSEPEPETVPENWAQFTGAAVGSA